MATSIRVLDSVKTASLRAVVVGSIREAILSGKLGPGTAVRAYSLARDLGVSQATVREALLELEHKGLITKLPGIGTTVIRLSSEELREHVLLRVVLEEVAAIAAAPKMTEADFAELDQKLQDICRAISDNLYLEVAEADLEFHRYIWRRSGIKTLYRMLDQLSAPMFAFVAIQNRRDSAETLSTASAVSWHQTSHQPIIDALKDGKPEMIREAFRKTITERYERFYERLSPI